MASGVVAPFKIGRRLSDMNGGRNPMIKVTRLNREIVFVNADLIEYVETTPDTVISLTTGEKFMVLETPHQIVDLVVEYERRIHASSRGESDILRFAGALAAVPQDGDNLEEDACEATSDARSQAINQTKR